MNRRGFMALSGKAFLAAAAGFGPAPARAWAALAPPPDLFALDAHAHPYWIHRLGRRGDPLAPTARDLSEAGVAACAFAAVGDMFIWDGSRSAPKKDVDTQLDIALDIIRYKKIRLLTEAGHLEPGHLRGGPGGFLAVEGGDGLEGRPENVDHFYSRGVRMMSLVHYRINELGDIMTEPPKNGGLTKTGARVVERINRLGIILDLSHADGPTLKEACRISARPAIDSHCSPVPPDLKHKLRSRLRTWDEMEAIAATGGLICLWPFGLSVDSEGRRIKRTMEMWAAEVKAVKQRFGMKHAALGTDSGGNLPHLVEGWSGLSSWPVLYRALQKAGLTGSELRAFFHGNLKRIWKESLS